MSMIEACLLVCLFLPCGRVPVKTHEKYLKTVTVKNATMSYVDTDGQFEHTVVFLHGNPTSSYLWRNIYPQISSIARCFAPDLIGMGRSDKVENLMYTFADHYQYFSEWMDKVVKTDKVILVLHDWGSILGFHWANMNRARVQSIVHMESVVAPFSTQHQTVFFRQIRSEAGEQMVLVNNLFVENFVPLNIIRNLTEEEMNEYRRPFVDPGEDRRPTLTFPRQVPILGEGPDDVMMAVNAYAKWLSTTSHIPKMLILAKPGGLSNITKEVAKDWPNQQMITVKGIHFIQEDSPKEITDAIYCFLNLKVLGKKALIS
uniref:haloalkane dehalogenase-like isoform X3 n=1 Tax=Styela clava TaxID=7725 RepID=UPI00193A52DA|nr:haloalkane dehalogenase-like isoform X3 [Styela clava]